MVIIIKIVWGKISPNRGQYILLSKYNFQQSIFPSKDFVRIYFIVPVLENFFNSSILAQSYHRAVHTADAIRLLLIYKFGGFYLDLDYVVLRDLSHYSNMLLEEG